MSTKTNTPTDANVTANEKFIAKYLLNGIIRAVRKEIHPNEAEIYVIHDKFFHVITESELNDLKSFVAKISRW